MRTQIINISLVISSLLSFAVGIKLIWNKDKKPDLLMSMMLFLIAIWAWGIYGTITWSSELASGISFGSVSLLIAVTVTYVLGFWQNQRKKILMIAVLIPAILISAYSTLPGKVVEKFFVNDGHIDKVPGPFYLYYLIFVLIYLGLLIWSFYKIYPQAKGNEKIQLKYIAWGLGISTIFSFVTNLLLPTLGINYLNSLGPILMLFMVAGIAYGLSRHRLLGPQVIFSELLAITLMLVVLIWLFVNYSIFNFVLFALVCLISFLFIRASVYEAREKLEIIKNERQLERDKVALESLDKLKEEFIKMATHELSSPLSVINSKLSMAFDEKVFKLTPRDEEFLMPVYLSSKRMSQLFKNVLQVINLESSSFILLKEETNLLELLSESIDAHVPTALKKNIMFKKAFPSKLPLLNIDKSKIKEVAGSFIENALKFSPDNSQVRISVVNHDNKVIIAVDDQGPGISDKDKKLVFEKFFQSDRFDENNPLEQQGSGLGLYISKKIVAMHGGGIGFESKEGKGSKFYFWLPIN